MAFSFRIYSILFAKLVLFEKLNNVLLRQFEICIFMQLELQSKTIYYNGNIWKLMTFNIEWWNAHFKCVCVYFSTFDSRLQIFGIDHSLHKIEDDDVDSRKLLRSSHLLSESTNHLSKITCTPYYVLETLYKCSK